MKLKIIGTLFITGITGVLLLNMCAPVVERPPSIPANNSGGSPPYINGKFDDMNKVLEMSFTDYITVTWDFLFAKNNRTPDNSLPVKPVDLSHFSNPSENQLNVTWLGHSSLMINIEGYKILTDPVFEKRVSIFGPSRFNGEVPLSIPQIPLIDVVLISHDHYDHLNKYSIRSLMDKTGIFAVPTAVGKRLVKWGVPRRKIVELGWWQEYRPKDDLILAATPAQHFSGRGITDRNRALWASWVIKTPSHSLFFSGDSGYFEGFRKIGAKYGPFDMTFLECGAYGESWPGVHMFPEQTVKAHLDLKGHLLHPIHWATFNLALHPWYEPMQRLSATAEAHGVKIATPVAGDTTLYNEYIPRTSWWESFRPMSEIL